MAKRSKAPSWTAAMRQQLPEDLMAYYRAQGARGGKIGGKRAAANMTPAQRTARARKASQAAAVARTKKKLAKG